MELSFIILNTILLWTIAVVVPGPNFFLTLQTAAADSRKAGLFTTLGIAAGTAIWGMAGYLGISALFAAAPWVYLSVKVAGGLYILYLGVNLIRRSQRKAAHSGTFQAGSSYRNFTLGLFTNLSNPKTAAFVASLFAATLPQNGTMTTGLMIIAIMVIISLLWYGLVAWAFSIGRLQQGYANVKTTMERVAGALFIAFGIRMIVCSK